MKLIQQQFTFEPRGRGTFDITQVLVSFVQAAQITTGICHIFIQHTSASLLICENADEQVRIDLENFLARLIPDGDPLFKHTAEGSDDMPAHLRTILTQTNLTIPIHAGRLALGTWQGVYLYEHRKQSQKRSVWVSLLSSA